MEMIGIYLSSRKVRKVIFWLSFIPAVAFYFSFINMIAGPGFEGKPATIGLLALPMLLILLLQVLLGVFAFKAGK